MGQTQLLLIALGVIIVGAAVIIGMNLFHVNAVEANRNGITNDLLTIANLSQAYYKKPSKLGGGKNSFEGFEIPARYKQNENGTFSTLYTRSDQALFEGVGKESAEMGAGCAEGQNITHRILVFPDSIRVQIVY
jgi:hypothetical protein